MNITEAKRVAALIRDHGYWGINIVLSYPELEYRVTALNTTGATREFTSYSEARAYIVESESRWS